MALLRFFVFALAGYLLLKIIGRYVLPWLGKKAVEKAQDSMKEKMEQQRSGKKVYESGDIEIRKPSESNASKQSDDDDYVDYVEIDK